jgi:hypothetical protein
MPCLVTLVHTLKVETIQKAGKQQLSPFPAFLKYLPGLSFVEYKGESLEAVQESQM